MKKSAADAKKAAANDKEEVDNSKPKKAAPKAKAEKPAEDAKYVIGSTETVKRGFLLEFVKFVKAKGSVDAAMLIAEFNGRQVDGRKVTVDRVHRYIAYAKNHGIIKVAK